MRDNFPLHASPLEINTREMTSRRVLWFLLGFFTVSVACALLDAPLRQLPDLRGFERTLGPLTALSGIFASLVPGIRFRDKRFWLLFIIFLLLFGFWCWRIYREVHA